MRFYSRPLNGGEGVKFPIQDLLRLHFISELGPSRIRKLIGAFKTPERIYKASLKELMRVDGFDEILAQKVRSSIKDETLITKVDSQLSKLDDFNAKIITIWDDDYPQNLRNIYNPPLLLFVKGQLLPEDVRSIAIVGTRAVSEYGRVTAGRIAADLVAQGITIVSGMAAGIDSNAHWGALKAGGRSLAVLGCGIDIVYPASNNALYKEIILKGAVISEFGFGTKPWPGNFPSRNRIISGISMGTVVVEAGKKSGALITAAAALEQNREVFAVPGNISSRHSDGTNALIRDSAAKLVQNADDILSELQAQLGSHECRQTDPEIPPPHLTGEEASVYKLVEFEPVLVDTMSQKSGMPTPKLLNQLLILELKGLIRKLPGNKYVRA